MGGEVGKVPKIKDTNWTHYRDICHVGPIACWTIHMRPHDGDQ